MVAQLPLNVDREASALVVHGDDQTRQLQPGVQFPADQRQRVEKLNQALEGEILRLHRDDHPVGGGQGIHGHRAQRRGAVDQGEDEALANRPEPLAQPGLVALDPRQLHRRSRQVAACGDQPEVVRPGRTRGLGHRHLTAETVI